MTSLERCVDRLKHLVAHNTVNPGGDEVGLCESLAQTLRDLGADEVTVTEVKRAGKPKGAYVYACFGTPTLLFNVHIDTVPVNSGWKRDPFCAEVEDGRLYGLGSCDIKGAVAAILTALETSKAQNIGVLFSGDEESGSECMPHFLAHNNTDAIAAAIVCEPTNRCAGLQHRGMLAYCASYEGKGGHSSKADFMEKPMVALAKFAVQLDEIAERWLSTGPANMQGLCMNVAQFTGGVAYNVVPDRGDLYYSVRPPPGFSESDFLAETQLAKERAHPKISITNPIQHAPFACGDTHRIRQLVGDFADAFVSLDFWTEAALLQEAGIDSVVIGPGDIAQAHTADEYVTLDDLQWATHMFETLIARHAS